MGCNRFDRSLGSIFIVPGDFAHSVGSWGEIGPIDHWEVFL